MSDVTVLGAEPPSFQHLILSRQGATLWVSLNRPEVKNALNRKIIQELDQMVQWVQPMLDIRIVVLQGSDGNFCAGGDVREMFRAKKEATEEGGTDPVARLNRLFGTIISTLYALPQTLIVALEGAVMGGGLGLACVADIVVATKAAQFRLPETSLGILPAQITPFLVERLGIAKTRKLALTGASLSGEQAEREGLVDFCCDDYDDMQQRIAQLRRQILRTAPVASRNTKRLILDVGRRNLDNALDDGAQLFAAALRSKEGLEGIMAFQERRQAKWVEDVSVDSKE